MKSNWDGSRIGWHGIGNGNGATFDGGVGLLLGRPDQEAPAGHGFSGSPWTLLLLVLAPSAAGIRIVFSARWALGENGRNRMASELAKKNLIRPCSCLALVGGGPCASGKVGNGSD